MKKIYILSLLSICWVILNWCLSNNTIVYTEDTLTSTGENSYTSDSWKDLPSSCQSFYDGCNHCNKSWNENDITCTEIYCEIYSEPYCKDDLPIDETNQNLDEQTLRDIYIWLSLDEAISESSKRSSAFRIIELDGESQIVTMDYRPWRINATINSGFVTNIDIE